MIGRLEAKVDGLLQYRERGVIFAESDGSKKEP